MNFLIQLISSIAIAFNVLNKTWWEATKLIFRNVGLMFLLGFIIAKSVYDWVIYYMNQALTALSQISGTQGVHSMPSDNIILQTLGLMDNFMPVGVILGSLVAFAVLWVACITYRFIKSWIPTVN